MIIASLGWLETEIDIRFSPQKKPSMRLNENQESICAHFIEYGDFSITYMYAVKTYCVSPLLFFTLENHCTRTAQSSRGGCSRRVYKIVYLAVKNGNILVNFLLLKIFIANNYHLQFQLYISLTFFALSVSHYSDRIMPKM